MSAFGQKRTIAKAASLRTKDSVPTAKPQKEKAEPPSRSHRFQCLASLRLNPRTVAEEMPRCIRNTAVGDASECAANQAALRFKALLFCFNFRQERRRPSSTEFASTRHARMLASTVP